RLRVAIRPPVSFEAFAVEREESSAPSPNVEPPVVCGQAREVALTESVEDAEAARDSARRREFDKPAVGRGEVRVLEAFDRPRRLRRLKEPDAPFAQRVK